MKPSLASDGDPIFGAQLVLVRAVLAEAGGAEPRCKRRKAGLGRRVRTVRSITAHKLDVNSPSWKQACILARTSDLVARGSIRSDLFVNKGQICSK